MSRVLAMNKVGSQDEYNAKSDQRAAEREEIARVLADRSIDGEEKMHQYCQYLMKYSKSLFTCPNCWLLPGLCICERVQRCEPRTKVVVHVHHKEWGKTSNTGRIAALSLDGSDILMRGFRPHDAQVVELLADSSITTAILWPGANSISCSELKRIADERTGGRMAVIAVDASWRGARAMKGFYPKDTLHVAIGPDNPIISGQTVSLLAPIRKYRGDKSGNGRVSTLEAIAALLYELEGDEALAASMLDNLRIKVDACRIQKGRPTAYGTIEEADLLTY
eukprot:CAMPEP_0202920514 /NCGR_PEP_ID=MMETSP1392-20130828/76892_1 /ASSEMBLY_ACC=CAM_ASM_000868 /TAXON_ID=225041 /ORGANISM="Chlamydomonas chlamydogama, Strain SAG 11-48b" /LENGTH=278 /DNA_ID=CAMNT_0049614011 /DNA_START=278 /DNA_END=1114 /DNA_ORIENTATION=+